MKWLFLFLFGLFFGQVSAQKRWHRDSYEDFKGFYQFKGKVNGKVPVSLWFVADGHILKGEVTYLNTSTKKPITVVGEVVLIDDFDPKSGDKIRSYLGAEIYEFDNKGYITGVFTLWFKQRRFEIAWSKQGSKTELPHTLIQRISSIKHKNISLKPTHIKGEYLYRYGENGDQGGIDIKQIDSSNYVVAINCVTAGPSHNVAEVKPFKAKLRRNQIVYKAPGSDCKFVVNLFNDFIIIDRVSEQCTFGAGATIDGIFFKTSDKARISQ